MPRIGPVIRDVYRGPGAEALPAHLERQYGIRVEATTKLDIGVLKVSHNGGPPWVARLFVAGRPVERAEQDAEVLRFLERKGIVAERTAHAEPVSTLNGRAVLVTEFVEGGKFSGTPTARRKMGESANAWGFTMAELTGSPAQTRCLLTVHAHPDDESEFGAPTVARYHHEGVRTVLVCCTDGGSGRIRNPDVGSVGQQRTDMAQIRRRELKEAAAVVGYDVVERLDYPDSGSVNLKERSPTCFARIPLEGPVSRLVEVIRRERPQVIVTYPDDQRVYPHPDHLRAHDVAMEAFDAAGSDEAYPVAGRPWQPLKLYYTITSRERRRVINDKYIALGMEAPFTSREGAGLQGRGDPELAPSEALVTTRVDVAAFAHKWVEGRRLHRCQVTPALAETLSIPPDVIPDIYGVDEYILARDLTQHDKGVVGEEPDLFARVGLGTST
jgi:mycothiol S-conjugate amidase